MQFYRSVALSAGLAVTAFLLGMSWAGYREVEAWDLATDAIDSSTRVLQESRASIVLALIRSLEAVRAERREDALAALEQELRIHTRLLEHGDTSASDRPTLEAEALQRARAYLAEHPEAAQRRLEPSSSPFSQAAILPEYEGGSCQGLRIAELAPDSFLASLGVKNNDLLVAVQDVPITSIQQVPEALREIEQQPADLRLDVERGGQLVRLSRR
jgi:C-terminal processing protease CtpA/Prc